MPANVGQWNCKYTPITTAGTNTLDPGQTLGTPKTSPAVFYGATLPVLGTSPVLTVLDIYAFGTTTTTGTLLVATGTAAGQRFLAGLEGVGVRYKGELLAINTGTNAVWNALWD